jgi:hypothetical protein
MIHDELNSMNNLPGANIKKIQILQKKEEEFSVLWLGVPLFTEARNSQERDKCVGI